MVKVLLTISDIPFEVNESELPGLRSQRLLREILKDGEPEVQEAESEHDDSDETQTGSAPE